MDIVQYEKDEEALSILTGLSRDILKDDWTFSLEWYEIIVPRLVCLTYESNLNDVEAQLLYVGFSKEFIDSMGVIDESLSIAKIIRIFIKYAISVVLKEIALDENGFPASIKYDINHLNEWSTTSSLGIPLFLSTNRDKSITPGFYFHGTSLKAAKNIIKYGINLDRCEPSDFGLKCFCLRDDMVSLKNKRYEALLCYNCDDLENLGFEIKTCLPNEEWSNIIYMFHYSNRKYHDRMEHYDIIKGPINAVRSDIITGVESIAPKIIDGIVANQIAFRSEKVCKEMDKRLKGVILYRA